ncbi:MAG: TIGR02300 family protein [Pseudomonadota bacterium]
MPKPEWGVKRTCPTTGQRFYDLNKDPIISPFTGEVVDLSKTEKRKPGRTTRATATPVAAKELVEEEEELIEKDETDTDEEEAEEATIVEEDLDMSSTDDDEGDDGDDNADDGDDVDDDEELGDFESDVLLEDEEDDDDIEGLGGDRKTGDDDET